MSNPNSNKRALDELLSNVSLGKIRLPAFHSVGFGMRLHTSLNRRSPYLPCHAPSAQGWDLRSNTSSQVR